MKRFSELSEAFAKTPLFAEKTWRIAAEPWRFSAEKARELEEIGDACLAFYRASEKLYLASASGKSLLRNGEVYAPWVAEILDRGKPKRFVEHQRSGTLAGTLPPVIRPDLLVTENGFALTELDSVPGGIGLTAFLEDCYCGETEIPELFFDALTDGNAAVRIAVAVSEESATYRPEFEYLSRRLRQTRNAEIVVCNPNELSISGDGVYLARERIDIVYRFFEMFDWANFPALEDLMQAAERGIVRVLPPMRTFQEEKMSLALFCNPVLDTFWREALGEKHFFVLKKIVPASWILEPVENLPAGACLLAPKPMRDWRELSALPRRERDYVLKASGFCEDAWGARSVSVGNDCSREEWENALEKALEAGRRNSLYILQDFKKPSCENFQIFDDAGTPKNCAIRARICPYYFVRKNREISFGGALATLCPADKKIIHGMSSAALAPCIMQTK